MVGANSERGLSKTFYNNESTQWRRQKGPTAVESGHLLIKISERSAHGMVSQSLTVRNWAGGGGLQVLDEICNPYTLLAIVHRVPTAKHVHSRENLKGLC